MVNAASTATRKLIICAVIAVIIGFVIGILIGRFATCPEPEKKDGVFLPGMSETLLTDGDSAVGQELLNSVDNTMIEKYLKYLTLRPHVAGSEKNLDLANWIKDNWLESGFDDVKLTPYDVLLSFPDSAHPNVVRLLNETGGIVYQSPPKEPSLTGEDDPDALPPYNAYSPSGLVEGEMVYVNYGRVEDFDFLEKNTSIDLKGKIVIARYGKIFRGSKVKLAALKGAIGVVLFSDPYDYTDPDEDRVYPDAWWLPGTGSQRGTVRTTQGDPLTPGYPAIKSAYRYKEDNPNLGLPVIPAHPIGYDIAEKILSEMGGEEAPTGWQGGLNLTYKLGPALAKTGWKIQINISTKNEMKRIYNVIGIIKGLIEPDRYVLMGNHRDAWVYGAMDPSSGTAVMMEASRVIGEKIKSGTWRPRRSLMFCSWGAEEYGLIGSDEWVEHYRKTLRERAIMYINVDIATHGNHSFFASGAPLIHQATYEAAKKVPNPNPEEVEAGRPTIYDTWLNNFPLIGADKKPVGVPRIWALGSASDYAALLQKAGVSAVDVFYAYNLRKYPKLAFYPLYHTVYETFYAVKNLVDRNFEEKECTMFDRNMALLDILPRCTSTAFNLFLQALLVCGEYDASDILVDKVDGWMF